jgi:hypothetical protein
MRTAALDTTCCIVGSGPAGMLLGYLLARAGVEVTVREKHNDFFRDFRGDTVHPSTLELMYELGLLADFLKVPHQRLTSVGGVVGDYAFQAAEFRHVPTHCKFVALMPQWDFLNFLAAQAKKFAGFRLLMQHEAVGLIRDSGRITGVEVLDPFGSSNESLLYPSPTGRISRLSTIPSAFLINSPLCRSPGLATITVHFATVNARWTAFAAATVDFPHCRVQFRIPRFALDRSISLCGSSASSPRRVLANSTASMMEAGARFFNRLGQPQLPSYVNGTHYNYHQASANEPQHAKAIPSNH